MILLDNYEIKLLEVQNSPKTNVFPENCLNRDKVKTATTYMHRQWACDFGEGLSNETIDIMKEISWKKYNKHKRYIPLNARNIYQIVINQEKDIDAYETTDISDSTNDHDTESIEVTLNEKLFSEIYA